MEQHLRRPVHAPTLPLKSTKAFQSSGQYFLPSPPLTANSIAHFPPDVYATPETLLQQEEGHNASVEAVSQKFKFAMPGRPKIRTRGESDLGRPALKTTNGPISPRPNTLRKSSSSYLQTPPDKSLESLVISGLILPLPWLLSSHAFSTAEKSKGSHSTVGGQEEDSHAAFFAMSLTAFSLMAMLGSALFLSSSGRASKRLDLWADSTSKISLETWMYEITWRIGTVWLAFYASIEMGGSIVALLMILSTASFFQRSSSAFGHDFISTISQNKFRAFSIAAIFAQSLNIWMQYSSNSTGYIAIISLLLLQSTSRTPLGAIRKYWPSFIQSALDFKFTAASAVVAFLLWTIILAVSPEVPLTAPHVFFGLLITVTAGLSSGVIRSSVAPIKSHISVAAGLLLVILFSAYNEQSWINFMICCAIGGAIALSSFLDNGPTAEPNGHSHHGHDESKHSPSHSHSHSHSRSHSHSHPHHNHTHSKFTGILLSCTAQGSIVHSILLEKDSRRIAYFACLNLAFMVVQFFYGFATNSLGLLTDSIHMLFDCLGLAVGLAAAVMSKWPPTLAFPYGYAKIETLSGFANGIFLMLVSVEIVFDAIHRLNEGYELARLNELLIVSTLGFLVNIVGLTAFGHAHHGHGHSHGHDHSHGHAHSHNHTKDSHSHDHHSDHDHNEKSNGHAASIPPTPTSPVHAHSHANENMQGIFLHILADALGSVAVIISTLLTKYNSWNGWDPLASCIIAILIFFSAIPLVKSSGQRLLLSLENDAEYKCRGVLQGISELRGVVGYAGVRLWMADLEGESHGHEEHSHEHKHDHSHGHEKHDHSSCGEHAAKASIVGVMHLIVERNSNLDDVKDRTDRYLKSRGFNVVIHVEIQGEGRCWCVAASRPAG